VARRRVLRWTVVLIALSVTGLTLTPWVIALKPGVSRENLVRLRYGMTLQQVEEFLGGPPHRKSEIAAPGPMGPEPAGTVVEWHGSSSQVCSLWFDTAGCLQQVNYREQPGAEPEIWHAPPDIGVFDRLRRWAKL
jgi:hypothetical protein